MSAAETTLDIPDSETPRPAPAADAPRTGGKLFRASAPFAKENKARTWMELATTFAAFAAMQAITALTPFVLAKLVGSVVIALISVRLFIFLHDASHGAIFRKDRLGNLVCSAIGMFLLTPPSVWRETHDYHHRNNAKMTGAAIGSYPVVTTRVWAMLKPSDRRRYALARNPLTIALGYVTIFAIGMCLSAFKRDPKQHWAAPLALILHLALVVGGSLTVGFQATLFAVILPVAISTASGSYLFYAQHNFPSVSMKDRREWDYTFAALRSSSMFDMSPWMHWFTGNIGYHHVHHLNHRIPFYRLPDAMAAIPELQNPGRTSWRVSDVAACLRLKLWDPTAQKMVGWR